MKKMVSILLTLAMIMTLSLVDAFAADAFPGSIAAPANFAATPDIENGSIYSYEFGISVPDNIQTILNNWDTWAPANAASELSILLECDYRYNDGNWHYSASWDQPDGCPAFGKMVDFGINEIIYLHADKFPDLPVQESALTGNTMYFRCRFAVQYYDSNLGAYVKTASPWSDTSACGKNAQAANLALVPPALVKAEVLTNADTGAPYFSITETIPDSIKTIDNTSDSVYVTMEYRKDGGAWQSLTWLSNLKDVLEFNPENTGAGSDINIEAAKYEVRCRFALNNPVQKYSDYSNILTVSTPAFYSHASTWAEDYLNQAQDLGIITDKMQGVDMSGPITREEFAEIAVKFYEMITGKNPLPVSPNPFKDCNNLEVLKAFNLKITAGTGDGTTFEPNAKLLRQQMATMITNTLRACFANFILDTKGQADFKDNKNFAAYAINPAKFMAKYGITVGDGKGSFMPNDTCTREQAIIFLVKSFLYKDQYIK